MRRFLVLAFIITSMTAGGWGSPTAFAQNGVRSDSEHPLIGSWLVEVEIDGQPPLVLPNLASFTGDGVAVIAAPTLLPELPGAGSSRDVFSAGHGAWTPTGENSASVRFAFLVVDERGNPASVNVVDGQLQVDETGATYTGEFTLTVVTAQGQTPTASGTWEASRIVAGAEPMATPTALGEAAAGATPVP